MRTKQTKVSIVITSFNRKKSVLRLLECVYRHVADPDKEIILVDNASTDGTVEALKRKYPQVILLENKENKKAVPARNQGFKLSKAKYILSIDSDNTFKEDIVSTLTKEMEKDKRIGMIGPLMLYYKHPKRVFYAGAKISPLTSITRYKTTKKDFVGQFKENEETGHVPNCFMFRRKVLREAGYMDEDYLMSYGESDFAEKIRRAGYKIVFTPKTIVYHDVPLLRKEDPSYCGYRTAMRAYFFARNKLVYMKKTSPFLIFLFFLLVFHPFFIAANVFFLSRRKKTHFLKAYCLGVWDGLVYALSGKLITRNIEL